MYPLATRPVSMAVAHAAPVQVPHVRSLPLGAVVLSTTGPQRTDLVGSVLLGSLTVFFLGYCVGRAERTRAQSR